MLRSLSSLTCFCIGIANGETMTAAGLAGPQKLANAQVSLIDVPIPAPGESDILVSVKASSINHLDLLWTILLPELVWDAAQGVWSLSGGFPKILGMDIAGTVAAVGSNVERFRVGDDVWAMNAAAAVYDGHTLGGLAGHAWAPYVVLREADAAIKPKSISFAEAGTLPLVAQTSLGALKAVGAPWKHGATVLIIGGTSGTGHVAIQIAKALGATEVIAVASASHSDFVSSLGATRTIDYHTEDWWNESVIPDRSVDAIYDTVLRPMTGDRAFAKLKDNGKYVSLCTGIPTCGAPMPSFFNRLKRPSLSATALRCVAGSCASADNLDELRSFIDAGKLRGHVDATVPLTDIQRGIDLLNSHHVVGKVGITIGDQGGLIV
eukprot:TRINITY_DN67893_c0_g1_i1.p1 TRINITY_DN67893_c0_g1~~TRINITY_DN67893_c0_g1_i1.p1  ORF type:complete len:379 (+),score=41.11 TRINITY_DN67893_c0_g1_i1:85-1221(+)